MRRLAVIAALALAIPAPVAADANSEIDALTVRVAKLEGVRSIKNLQRAFGYYVDRGLWGEAANPDDAVYLDLWEEYLDVA